MKSKHAESLRSLSKAPARFETFKNELASGLLDLENTMSRKRTAPSAQIRGETLPNHLVM